MDRDNLDWALHVYGKAPLAHPHDRPLALARDPAPSRPWTTAQIIRPQPACSYIMKYFKTHICCHTSQMLSVHATHIISPSLYQSWSSHSRYFWLKLHAEKRSKKPRFSYLSRSMPFLPWRRRLVAHSRDAFSFNTRLY